MSIIAKYSHYKLGNLKIAAGVLIAFSVWCVYDGYYSESFIEKHTETVELEDGTTIEKPNHTLIFCQKFPFVGFPLAAIAVLGFITKRNKQLVADSDGMILSCGEKILYKNIEEIDHTEYEKKGFFLIKYQQNGKQKSLKLSNKTWDELEEVLDELVSKMS
jgi:hypothetical protein